MVKKQLQQQPLNITSGESELYSLQSSFYLDKHTLTWHIGFTMQAFYESKRLLNITVYLKVTQKFSSNPAIHSVQQLFLLTNQNIKQTWPKCGPWTFFCYVGKQHISFTKTNLVKNCTYFFSKGRDYYFKINTINSAAQDEKKI